MGRVILDPIFFEAGLQFEFFLFSSFVPFQKDHLRVVVLGAESGEALATETLLPVHVLQLDFDGGCFGVSFQVGGQQLC